MEYPHDYGHHLLQICMSYCDMGFDLTGNTTVLICDEADSASATWQILLSDASKWQMSKLNACNFREVTVAAPNIPKPVFFAVIMFGMFQTGAVIYINFEIDSKLPKKLGMIPLLELN